MIQRALFALAAGRLIELEKGAALARLLQALPSAGEDFTAAMREATGLTPSELERGLFEEIDKK